MKEALKQKVSKIFELSFDIETFKFQGTKLFDRVLLNFANEEVDYDRPLPLDNEVPNFENQRILRNLDAHKTILIIVKQNNQSEVQNKDLFYKVLRSGYSALIRFVRRNKANQKCIIPYLDTHFEDQRDFDLGLTQLVGETSRDDLSTLQKAYSDIKEKVAEISCQDSTFDKRLKSTQMHYLSVYMKYKDEVIVENQVAVITELIKNDRSNTICLFNSDQERLEL